MIYKQGKVTFKSIDKDGFFNCSVQGNGNIYSTAIKVEDNIVLQSCNCPVHYTYGKCKHVYATALTYEEYLKQNDEQAIISVNTTNLNTVRNNYKLELNRILKSCEDKVVKLSKNVELKGKEVIEVNDFGELIKLSEELYKPILYWNSNLKEESDFFVITNNVIYKFVLNAK